MSKLSHKQIIDKLAVFHGIEPEYTDNWGRNHQTSIETKRKILRAIGVNVDTKAQATKALDAGLEREWSRMTAPAIVTTISNVPKQLVFQIPLDNSRLAPPIVNNLKVSLEVIDEQNIAENFTFTQKDLTLLESKQAGNRVYARWSIPFPRFQAFGYYRFHLSVLIGDLHRSETIFVAICPDKAYIPQALQGEGRAAGISVSLYAVRSERNWGVGDLGDLKEIVDWVAEDLHGGIVGLNPLHAIFNRRPFNTSPYLPISRFYRNFIYLDIPAIKDFYDSLKSRNMIDAPETQQLLSELRASETVEYEQVAELKQRVLKEVFKTFLKNHWNSPGSKTDRKKDFECYIEREGDLLENFATFCALDETFHARDSQVWTWTQWPQGYQRPDNKTVRQFRKEHHKDILYYKYVQWQLEKQLARVQDYAKSRGMCIGLYHDLALAIDRFSADFWAYQDFFVSGLRVGAPPDAFSQNGQDWGFPPPSMEKFQERGYGLFVKEIQKNCAFGGALRIDHVMRFFHLYCMPEGESPKNGAYLSQPFEDLLKILALESFQNKVIIIGEDLGTVPSYIRDKLKDANIFSYRLLYFEKDEQQHFIPPQSYPESALVSVSTHDLPTLAGFWAHKDIEARKEADIFENHEAVINASTERERDKQKLLVILEDLKLLPEHWSGALNASEVTGEIHNAVVGFLALTPAKLLILSQEDLFKATDQQNLPGTTVEYPNWSLKMKFKVEQLCTDSTARAFSGMFKNWVDRTGRHNPSVGGM